MLADSAKLSTILEQKNRFKQLAIRRAFPSDRCFCNLSFSPFLKDVKSGDGLSQFNKLRIIQNL